MKFRITTVLIFLFVLLSAALAFKVVDSAVPSTDSRAASYTQTPTPFQPIPNTPVWEKTPFQPFYDTPVPNPTQTPTKAPTPTRVVYGTPDYFLQEMPSNTVNLVLLGSDQRYSADFRTDTILFVSINPAKGAVSLVSIPRDLWLDMDGVGEQRINTAMEFGGFPLLATTFQENFGVRPRYYLMINFDNFMEIIDGLGGVTLTAGKTLIDQCDLPQADKYGSCIVKEGETVHMDGATTLWYIRSRHTSSDFDRMRRVQEVIVGVSKKLLKPGFAFQIPKLYDKFQSSVETNMDFGKMISLLPMAPIVLGDTNRIHLFTLGAGAVEDYKTEEGWRVLKPHEDVIRWIMTQAIYPP